MNEPGDHNPNKMLSQMKQIQAGSHESNHRLARLL